MSEDNYYEEDHDSTEDDQENLSEAIKLLDTIMSTTLYQVENVLDFSDDLSGKVIYDPETKKLLVHAPIYVKSYSLNNLLVSSFIKNKLYTFDFFSVIESYQIDESKIPSCKYFVPSSQLVELGSKTPDSWKFTEPPLTPCCTHQSTAHMGLKAYCSHLPSLVTCKIYAPEDWTDIQTLHKQDGTLVSTAQYTFSIPRILKLRISHSQDFEKIFGHLTEEFTDVESMLKAFNTHVDLWFDTFGEKLEIRVNDSIDNPYIEKVLS